MALFVVLLCSTQSCQEQSEEYWADTSLALWLLSVPGIKGCFLPAQHRKESVKETTLTINYTFALKHCFKLNFYRTPSHTDFWFLSCLNNDWFRDEERHRFSLAIYLFYFLLSSLFIQVCSSLHVEMISYARLVSTESELWSPGK